MYVTEALRDPASRERVVETIRDLAAGATPRSYGGDLRAFLDDNPGLGPLFERVPNEVNVDGNGRSRMQNYVEEAKQVDPARQVGRDPTPEQAALVREYAQRLGDDVEPAIRTEITRLVDDLTGDLGDEVHSSVRTKDAEADMEHNSIYKPYISVGDREETAVRRAMREAAALDQQETGGTGMADPAELRTRYTVLVGSAYDDLTHESSIGSSTSLRR